MRWLYNNFKKHKTQCTYIKLTVYIDIILSIAVYGWMKDISSDFQTAEPLTTLDSIEGEELILNVYFMRNGPSHTDDLQFTIYNSGTAKGMLIIRALYLNGIG